MNTTHVMTPGADFQNIKSEILKNANQPAILEKLYRKDPEPFKKAVMLLYSEQPGSQTIQFWHARLFYENDSSPWISRKEMLFIAISCILAGVLAKLPDWSGWNPEQYYLRNMAFIVFPFLSAYFAMKKNLKKTSLAIACVLIVVSALYLNLLPGENADTLILACIHIPFIIWAVAGYCFIGGNYQNPKKTLDYLRYNGDLLVMSSILLLAGALCTAITISLFELIDVHIADFYMHSIGIWGLASIPIIATFLVYNQPQLVQRISPLVAKLFSPLAFLILLGFLSAIVYTGKDPYNDRTFLLICNILLLAVMALIFFSCADHSKSTFQRVLLFGLSLVSIVINGVALSAILFRIQEWGFTPNRICVLGSNLLILSNLTMVCLQLYRSFKKDEATEMVGSTILKFIPAYLLWAALVGFIFPFVFGFK